MSSQSWKNRSRPFYGATPGEREFVQVESRGGRLPQGICFNKSSLKNRSEYSARLSSRRQTKGVLLVSHHTLALCTSHVSHGISKPTHYLEAVRCRNISAVKRSRSSMNISTTSGTIWYALHVGDCSAPVQEAGKKPPQRHLNPLPTYGAIPAYLYPT